jgi:N-methylhydantoinase A
MGGTSTDVSPILGGRVQTKTDSVIAGIPIRLPMADVHSVGAGGGSIAWVDDGGALRVGPRSAGAEPGPACYGRGGEDATVTDADLVLGYLEDGAKLGGEIELNRALGEEAVERIGRQLGLDPIEAASGIVRVANEEMLRALRLVTVRRGLDPREFTLVAFGGAGPMHACALAGELGVRKIVVPRESGVLSALGLALSEVRRDYLTPHMSSLAEISRADLERMYGRMEDEARATLKGPRLERRADLRYRGQSFELTVGAGDLSVFGETFHRAHENRYGYRMEDQPVEVVSLRLVATGSSPPWDLAEGDAHGDPRRETRKANFQGTWVQTRVLDRRSMGRGSEVEGPAIVELSEATCVVEPGWSGAVTETGNLLLERV